MRAAHTLKGGLAYLRTPLQLAIIEAVINSQAPLVSIVLAVAAATTNLRLLRKWHAETGLGDITHPLLQPDEKIFGFTQLTKKQASNLDDQYSEVS